MTTPQPVRRAVVVGTGSMGPEIAAALAHAGVQTTIAGRDDQRTQAAARRATDLPDGSAVSPAAIEEATFADVDLVVETISEDLDAKRALYARIEPWCAPGTTLATNTSSLPVADLASALAHPERFGGLHFLKPAHLTGVVEVVPGACDETTLARLMSLAAAMGKSPLVVRQDVPGFIWNRIQFAVLRECLHMLERGVASAADIDAAVSDGLAPRWMAAGPLATADLGGLSTFATICAGLFPHLSSMTGAPAAITAPAASGEALQPWTARAPEEIAELRAAALAAGREIATRRRELAG